MLGWILYSKSKSELDELDNGVNRLLQAAEAKGITLEVFKPEEFELVVSRNDKKSIFINNKETAMPDFLIPRIGSQTSYFGLAVIRQIERLGVYSCNSSQTIEIVKDKLQMHQLLAHHQLPTPNTMLVKFPIDAGLVKQQIGFPLVVKNITGTEGKGIYLIHSEEQFVDLMELLYANNPASHVILQEFIQSSYGKDLRVFVLGGKVIGCIKRYSESSFKANFSRGGKVASYELTPEIEHLATTTARLVNLDIAGVDILFDNEGFKICEANSSPGFKGLEKVIGHTVAEQILDYIVLRLESKLFV